ncbi:hypothetical protein KC949_03670, partial [Candidatus Saccharibacteria bacterium]|nr:hypothetical protein [Candidatus Saccharibacteria bacterium]
IAPDVATAFNFEAFREPWNASVRKEQLDRYYREIGADNIPNQVNGNHDNTRLATRLGHAARAAHVMNLLLPGLRVVYSGEELGLTDGHVPVERAQDLNGYRDGARTPVPWDNSAPNAGFSDAPEQDLWLPVNEKDLDIAVNMQQGDSKSMLNLTKSTIRLCRLYDSLENGDYEPVSGSNDENVLVYARAHKDNRMYVAVNFSDAWQMTKVDGARGRVVLSSDTVQDDLEARGRVDSVFHLAPNEQIAVVAE